MSETLTTSSGGLTAGRGPVRAPLTHVPLSTTPLGTFAPTEGPWPGRQYEIGAGAGAGLRLHARTTGTDDARATAVYVHGLGGSATNWTDLGRLLAPHAYGHALDLPGFGFSEPLDGFSFSLTAHADAVVDYLTAHADGDGAPVHLVGNSMGGAVSMLVAARRPELVRTLTLISPAVPDLRPDPRRLSDPRLALAYLPMVGRRARKALAAMTPQQRAEQVIRLCFADPASFPAHRYEEIVEEHSTRAAYAWAEEAMARSTMEIFRAWFTRGSESLWSLARTITTPSLVVWGTQDRVISVRRAPRTARLLPRGRLLVLPRTGHVAQMERPTTVAKAVLGLWESVDSGLW